MLSAKIASSVEKAFNAAGDLVETITLEDTTNSYDPSSLATIKSGQNFTAKVLADDEATERARRLGDTYNTIDFIALSSENNILAHFKVRRANGNLYTIHSVEPIAQNNTTFVYQLRLEK